MNDMNRPRWENTIIPDYAGVWEINRMMGREQRYCPYEDSAAEAELDDHFRATARFDAWMRNRSNRTEGAMTA